MQFCLGFMSRFKGFRETQIVTGFHAAALILGVLSLAGLGLTA